jgi:hypothetical protein
MTTAAKKLVFQKRGNILAPMEQTALNVLGSIKNGDMLFVSIHQPRNILQHRFYWALMNKVASNTDKWPNAESLSDAVKIATGHCEPHYRISGEAWLKPKSISFASMPQADFKEYMDKAFTVICRDVIPELDITALQREVGEMLSGEVR